MNELSIQIKYYDFTIHLSIEKVWIRPSAMALLATFRSYFPLLAKLQVKWGISLALKWKLNLFLSFGFHFWVFVLNWKASYCHLERCCQGCRTAWQGQRCFLWPTILETFRCIFGIPFSDRLIASPFVCL